MNHKALYETAIEANRNNCPITAIGLLEKYIKSNEKNEYARFLLAENLRILGLSNKAERVLRTIQDIPAEKRWLLEVCWGQIYMDRGEFILAEAPFRKAIDLNPASSISYVLLGNCLAKQERFQESCEILMRGLSCTDPVDEIYFNLGLNKRALNDYEAAIMFLKKALDVTPEFEAAKHALTDIERWLSFDRNTG